MGVLSKFIKYGLMSFLFSSFMLMKISIQAQIPTPIEILVDHYIVCPGSTVTLGVVPQSGVSFFWFSSQTGGNALNSLSSNTFTVSNAVPPQIYWVEPRVGATVYPREPIYITQSAYCGNTTPRGCASTGTLIYKEDFGGNNTSDPKVSPVDLIGGRSDLVFNGTSPGSGNYGLIKYDYRPSIPFLYNFDHTHLDDRSRGYFMYIDPASNQMNAVLYEYDIVGLCPDVLGMSFTVWMADLQTAYANPKVEMQILDKNTNDILITTGTFALPRQPGPAHNPSNPLIWRQYGFDFNLPTGVSDITFRLINKEVNNIGNDWAIDDVEICLCIPPITITNPLSDTMVCAHSSIALTGAYTDNGTFGNPLTYRWEYSSTGDIDNPAAWTTLTTSTSTNPLNTIHSISDINVFDTGYYRLLVGTSTSINQSNCRATSTPVKIEINPLFNETVIYDTICIGVSYAKHGFNISASELQTVGTFEFRDSVSNSIGCDDIIILNLTVNSLDAEIVKIQLEGEPCIGDTILLRTGITGANILWSTGEITDQIKLNTSGVYWASVMKYGCEGRDTIRIEFVEKPTVNIIVEGDSCASGGVRLKAETTVSDIRWNTGATTSGISINNSGTYWVLVDEKGCTNADTTNIILGIPSAAISQKGEICDKEILLRVDTEAPDVRWNTGETSREISVTTSGVYEVEVGRGACTGTYATNVTINRVDINIAEEGDLCQTGTMQLIAETNASWFLWNTGSVDSVITITKQGVYTVTASNSDCETTETKAVICECDLVFPNAFDPSSVTNATFGPVENEVVTSYKMYIYDRWGKMLFETNSMTDRWDGRYKGKNLPQGAYVYLSYYTCIGFDRFYEKSGTVLLIR